MKDSKIEWCDSTFNPWIGCTKVSPGCANCYAESRDKRFAGGAHWGPGAPRQRTSEANWKQPLSWNKTEKWDCPACDTSHTTEILPVGTLWECHCTEPHFGCHNRRPRVFCGSLCDWLDDEVPLAWLADLMELIRCTPNLDWLLLTKRPENFSHRFAALAQFRDFGKEQFCWELKWYAHSIAPSNVWIGTTVEDQARANERVPELLKIPAKVRFLSCEPLLGPVDLREAHITREKLPNWPDPTRVDWVICGGESGPNARPMHPDWARTLRDQCSDKGVPFLFKQWGEWANAGCEAFGKVKPKEITWIRNDGSRWDDPPEDENADCLTCIKVGKKAAGRLLDGVEHNGFPEVKP
jgi:protein gp37